jgi:1-acyl-sn-glycerol-3-phosphate acyltransferase
MFEAAFRCWRVVATGLCFALFGIGGLLLRVLVFPLLSLLVWQREARIGAARAIIRLAFRAFVETMRGLGVLRYEIIGLEKLDRRGLLILANHPTLIDTVFLMAFVRRADCVVKSGLWNNPFTRGPVRAAGYINSEHGSQLIEACVGSLGAGNNLIVFPEGTRTPAGGEIALKRGAANIAVRGGSAVTPVLISCTPSTLGKGGKWWQVPRRTAQFRIEVKDDIEIYHFTGGGMSDVIAARRLTEHLQTYFAKFTKESRIHA